LYLIYDIGEAALACQCRSRSHGDSPRWEAAIPSELTALPLYEQVRRALLLRLIDGRWPPGSMLPSEQQIAAELGVSWGTARKALDSLAQERLLVRQQGRGTFVAIPEEGKLLFQFFHLVSDSGERVVPRSVVHSLTQMRPDALIRERLGVARGEKLWRIERTRYLEERPLVSEVVVAPQARFPGLNRLPDIPNNLYSLYSSQFGTTIVRAAERLMAVAAEAADAERLGCAEGAPLLEIERTAYALDGAAVEWRLSRCRTDSIHYGIDLR
jgi:GntR family transcriptional regulator